jgi:serine/threonine protein kinase
MDFTLTQIFQRVKNYDKNLIGYIIREIVKGVKLLHSYGIIHRDLKPDNIFVNKLGQVKIGDLGNCAQLTRERELRDTFAGSPYWTAPEIILSQKYGKACDIWSIGMIFFEMLEGKLFFEKCRNIQQLINAMKSQTFTSFAREHSEDSIEFFQSCANYQPILRKAADELLDLSIFSNIDERKAKQQLLGK